MDRGLYRIPGIGPRTANWDFPSGLEFTDRYFHEDLRDRYGPRYRDHPDARFQYHGGWDGRAGRVTYDDWRGQFMDMQRDGRYQTPYHGGFW
jgi:hypothetical protein